jgi:hypothetical protein
MPENRLEAPERRRRLSRLFKDLLSRCVPPMSAWQGKCRPPREVAKALISGANPNIGAARPGLRRGDGEPISLEFPVKLILFIDDSQSSKNGPVIDRGLWRTTQCATARTLPEFRPARA